MKKIKEIKEKMFARFKGMTFKSYLKETLEFFNNNLKKTFFVLGIISVLIIAMGITSSVKSIQSSEYSTNIVKDISFGESYFTNIQVIVIIIFAGIVPYMYVPVIGCLSGTYNELITFAYLTLEKGYLKATIMYILPILLNISIICIATALGMYICKSVTSGYKLDNMKHMNSTNFRLELYKLSKKDKKQKELEDKKNKKIKELENKHKKIDYFQVFNITIILFVLQLIASLLRVIVI